MDTTKEEELKIMKNKINEIINDFLKKHDIKKLSIDYDADYDKKNNSYSNYTIGIMIMR